ncbi:MAG: hypothetical protein R3C46_04525 [Hyphomonadaceae bacterium]
MQWLWIILRWLFPSDPLRQCAEVLRHRAVQLVEIASDPGSLLALAQDPAGRLHVETLILDAEDMLRLWIAMRGCQIARIRPNRPRRRVAPHLTRPKSVFELIARIGEFAVMCADMERLAQRHADKLIRLRDADPLAAYAPPHLRSSRRTPGSRADIEPCSVLQLQACSRSATVPESRLSSGRAGVAPVSGRAARGPPLPIVSPHPQHASQARLRGRRRLSKGWLSVSDRLIWARNAGVAELVDALDLGQLIFQTSFSQS